MLSNVVIAAFLITTSACRHAVRTISSLESVGRSWRGYCWDSPSSLYTFRKH